MKRAGRVVSGQNYQPRMHGTLRIELVCKRELETHGEGVNEQRGFKESAHKQSLLSMSQRVVE